MGRTRTQVRLLTARQFPYPAGFTGTAGSGTTTTLVDTPDLSQFSDDRLIGYWVYLVTGTPNFRTLQITDFTQAGTITFQPAIDAFPTTPDYEILPFSATEIHFAIDEALLLLYDQGVLSRQFWLRGLVAGSPLYNAGFDYWTSSTAVDGWTLAGSGAVLGRERNSVNIGLSETSASIQRVTNDATLSLATLWRRFLWDFKGESVTYRGWVRASVASRARIGLNNGSTTTYSSYHTGDSDWELLSVTLATTTTDTDLYPVLSVDTGDTTAYFADSWLSAGTTVRELPWPVVLAPDGPVELWRVGGADSLELKHLGKHRSALDWQIYKHHDENTATEIASLWLPSDVAFRGERLWARCEGPLTLPTADADNIEVNQYESLLVAKQAALLLAQRRLATLSGTTLTQYSLLAVSLRQEVEMLKGKLGGSSGAASLGPRW